MARNFQTLIRMSRSYVAPVEKAKLPAQFRMRKVVGEAVETNPPAKEVFWMRDPNTGNWLPENHLGQGEVDAAQLREKLLPNKSTS